MEERLYTVRDLAEMFHLSERAVRDKINRGTIRGTRPGGEGKWLIRQSEVERLSGKGEADELSSAVAKLETQLYTPAPEISLIQDFGGLGIHNAGLDQKELDIVLRDLAHGAGFRTTIMTATSTPAAGENRQVYWKVAADGSLQLYCPLAAEPPFREMLSARGTSLSSQFDAWGKEGGRYLAACSQALAQIQNDARARTNAGVVEGLARMRPSFVPSPPPPLTSFFGNLVYQLAVRYCRSEGAEGLPDASLYQAWQRDSFFSDLTLGQARIHIATTSHGLVGDWASIQRQMIVDWGKSEEIASLLRLFNELHGIENKIRRELHRLAHRR